MNRAPVTPPRDLTPLVEFNLSPAPTALDTLTADDTDCALAIAYERAQAYRNALTAALELLAEARIEAERKQRAYVHLLEEFRRLRTRVSKAA